MDSLAFSLWLTAFLNRYLGWPAVTRDHVGVFKCPADRGSDIERPTFYDYRGTSYMTNYLLVAQDELPVNFGEPCLILKLKLNQRLMNLNRSRISNEAKLLLMGDAGWFTAFAGSERVEWHGGRCRHNISFMDGHAEFIQIRTGLFVTDKYTLVPFRDLQQDAIGCQREEPCE